MVTKGRHQSHETESNFRMLGKTPTDTPREAQDIIKTGLTVSRQNYGKDSYIIDLDDPERKYWLWTESGLLDSFHFDGT